MNKKIIVSVVILALVGLGLGFFFLSGRGGDKGPESLSGDLASEGKFDQVPAFNLKDWDGSQVSLSDFKGRSVILNSWAVWCPFCLDELPDFVKLQEELGDSVTIVAIDRAESTEKQKEFTDKLGVTGKLLFLNDPDDSFYQSIGGFSMPETLFVDKEGNIRLHKRGPMDIGEMRRVVKNIL